MIALAAVKGCRSGGLLVIKAPKAEGVEAGEGAWVVKGPLAHRALDHLLNWKKKKKEEKGRKRKKKGVR